MELFNQQMADWLIDYNTIIPHHSFDMKNLVQYLIENHQEFYMLWTNTHKYHNEKNLINDKETI